MKPLEVYASNMAIALAEAIKHRKAIEEANGQYSVQRHGWEQTLEALRRGQPVIIKQE